MSLHKHHRRRVVKMQGCVKSPAQPCTRGILATRTPGSALLSPPARRGDKVKRSTTAAPRGRQWMEASDDGGKRVPGRPAAQGRGGVLPQAGGGPDRETSRTRARGSFSPRHGRAHGCGRRGDCAESRGAGYAPDTVMLVHLVPLLQVAWADGGVSDGERGLIIEAARAHGVDAGSTADQQLRAWLETRPSPEFFQKTLKVIGAMLQAGPSEERQAAGETFSPIPPRLRRPPGGSWDSARSHKRKSACSHASPKNWNGRTGACYPPLGPKTQVSRNDLISERRGASPRSS